MSKSVRRCSLLDYRGRLLMGVAPDVQTISQRMEVLGLGFVSAGLESFLSDQSHADLSLIEVIARLLELEYIPRKELAHRTRLILSSTPQTKLPEDFDISWLKGGLIQRKENILLLGPNGISKTQLLLGLGHKARMDGYSAYTLSRRDAFEQLRKAREQNRMKRKLKWFCEPNPLLHKKIGHENRDPEKAPVFFQLAKARNEAGSKSLAANRPYGNWAEPVGNAAVGTATLDRILRHAHVLTLQGDCCRAKNRLQLGVVDFG